MAAAKKPSAIMVERDRKTTALPPMQLGSFHKLFTPDEYEGKKKFKSRFHLNPAGIEALKACIQEKCINAHFEAMKAEVDEWTAEAKAQKKTPPVAICDTIDGCQSPGDFLEEKLREPHEKDKVQLPTIQLHVEAYLPLRKGQDEADREMRTIKFWDSKGNLIEEPEKRLAKMTSGTWCQPIVHANLFLSKQLGKNPRPQLQLVGLQIIKLVEYGSNEAPPSAADDDEMRRIMGDDYSVDDDLANFAGKAPGSIGAVDESVVEDPF